MENVATKYYEGEEINFPEEVEKIEEIDKVEEIDNVEEIEACEESAQKIDDKTKRKARYVKRRKARIHEVKKSKLSATAQKKKKEERRKNLGASIISKRKSTYKALQIKRAIAQAT